MSDYDLYREVEYLITLLKLGSLSNYCDKLQQSIDDGSTGTEIVMALKWNLTHLIKEKKCSQEEKIKAHEIIKELGNLGSE